jgi:putative transposase
VKRTICLKLLLSAPDLASLSETESLFAEACNALTPMVQEHRCWNQVALHQLGYYAVREKLPLLGSQMVCNAIRKVCAAYKTLKLKKSDVVPAVRFRGNSSIHYCARTFSIREETISLFSVRGRIRASFVLGKHQKRYLAEGKPKEAELVCRGNRWFLHLVVDLPDVVLRESGPILGVDCGENNLATTSTGTIHGGGKLRHERDKFLARRRKLQSNGSPAAKRCLKRISGREKRHVRETNHRVSKAIVQEALAGGAAKIAMEDLTNIRKRIRAGKRMRTRLHRWSFSELQEQIAYKAEASGLQVVYVNPAYTSLTCSHCDNLGFRKKHRFFCPSCGSYQHSDRNAAINHCKLAGSVVPATALVNVPMVAALRLATSSFL